ncbi:MAG: hypothetical protein R2861_00250 [Desulfobacterales bacterium]
MQPTFHKRPMSWIPWREAYYVNAEYADALRMGEKALARAETDRSYYRKQIEKFKDALKKGR